MPIYTGTGDRGMTSLSGGQRVSKDDARVVAYGTVDELSSQLGLLASICGDGEDSVLIRRLQRDLFVVGGFLSSGDFSAPGIPDSAVKDLEDRIDSIQKGLAPLRSFILPGGCEAAARCHVCRTVCRRAERAIVSFLGPEGCAGRDNVLVYVNRLSDLLFVLARKLNADAGVVDIPLQ